MTPRIAPLAESHFAALSAAQDAVAREKRLLALMQAPPMDEALALLQNIVDHDHPQFVALLDERVVGRCDMLPAFGDVRRHLSVLGIGLAPEARHRNLRALLMRATVAKAWDQGLTRIELTLRTDNHNARAVRANGLRAPRHQAPRLSCRRRLP